MVRRTKQEALATRGHILDSAERVFERRGVSRTSLHEIAAAAGLTRGAIYWHFKDKADLFHAMMQRVTLPMEQTLERSDSAELADPLAHICASLIGALHQAATDPQVRRVFEIATHKVEYVAELQVLLERRVRARNDCWQHVERGLQFAMERGQLGRRLPAHTAAIGLHALIDGLLRNWMLDTSAFDLVAVARQLLDTYLAGLAD